MSAKAACAQCPFRVGSGVCYDADALEALADGAEPSCHMVVGMNSIFHAEPPTDKQRCTGHDLWIDGAAGFREPSGAGPFALAVPEAGLAAAGRVIAGTTEWTKEGIPLPAPPAEAQES